MGGHSLAVTARVAPNIRGSIHPCFVLSSTSQFFSTKNGN
jgi:hypothetical protein